MQSQVDKVVDMREGKKISSHDGKKCDKASVRAPCGFIAKLKSIKHIEVIVAIVVIAVMVLCYGMVVKGKDKEVSVVDDTNKLCAELQEILSNIKGVGSAEVLIVFDGGNRLEIASKVDRETNTITDEGRVTVVESEVSSPIMVNGKPLVLSEKRAPIDGIIVVAEGGGDMNVRVKISRAVCALLNVPYEKVQVFEKK